MYLNVGCGKTRYKGVINVDVVKNELTDVDVLADMRVLPYEDGTVKGIIANHVLEHLEDSQHGVALAEWRRVLEVGGKLLIGVPDLETVCQAFLDNQQGRRDYFYMCLYGALRYPFDRHLSGFTRAKLTDLLFSYGFHSLKWRYYDVNMEVVALKGDMPRGRLGESDPLELYNRLLTRKIGGSNNVGDHRSTDVI